MRKPAAIASRNNTHRHPPPLTTPALWLIAGRAYDPDTAGIYARTYAMPEPTYIRTYVRIRIINSDDDDDDGYDDDDNSDDDHDDNDGGDEDHGDDDDDDDNYDDG